MLRRSRKSNAMAINCTGTSASVTATKASAIDMTRIMKAVR
jgi:hypothetical protein